jgi:hypothetical protein
MPFVTTNAAIVRKLADVFEACSISGLVRYEELSKALGSPIDRRLYLAYRAMDLANRETGAIFVNVRQSGYQRMQNDEAHALGKRARLRGRRLFSRASKSIANVLIVANDMSNTARIKAFSEQAALGLLVHMTYDRNRPIIRDGATPPPTSETIRASLDAMRAARSGRLSEQP